MSGGAPGPLLATIPIVFGGVAVFRQRRQPAPERLCVPIRSSPRSPRFGPHTQRTSAAPFAKGHDFPQPQLGQRKPSGHRPPGPPHSQNGPRTPSSSEGSLPSPRHTTSWGYLSQPDTQCARLGLPYRSPCESPSGSRSPNRAATIRERCAKLIGCGRGGGPKEPSPGGLTELSVGVRGWGSGPAGGGGLAPCLRALSLRV